MKKIMVLSAAVCVAMAFTSCKSSESAYRKAYDKAASREAAYNEANNTDQTSSENDAPVVAPVEERAVGQTAVVDNNDNIAVRHEDVNYESGAELKAYNVVVGSYTIRANAEDLLSRLQRSGYQASIASADINGTTFYRVISATADTKSEAARSRDAIRGTQFNAMSDAWILAR